MGKTGFQQNTHRFILPIVMMMNLNLIHNMSNNISMTEDVLVQFLD